MKHINSALLHQDVSHDPHSNKISPDNFKWMLSVDKALGSGIFASPYITDGTNYYDTDGFICKRPPKASSLTWIGTPPSSIVNGPNGNLKIASGGVANPGFQSQPASSSSEVILRECQSNGSTSFVCEMGCWLWDSTNQLIYTVGQGTNVAAPISIKSWTYTGGVGQVPVVVSTIQNPIYPYGPYVHLKMKLVGNAIVMQICLDGQSFDTLYTTGAVGTILKGGFYIVDSTVNLISSLIHLAVS